MAILKRFWIFAVITLTLPVGVLAQQNNFKNWSVQDGLPQSDIYSMVQDANGFIWVGTNGGGMARFNGQRFDKIYNADNGLAGNNVRALLADSKGNLWIGSDGGLAIYNGYTFRIINNDDSLKGSSVINLLEDIQGRIWAGTDDGGVNVITVQNDSISIYTIDSRQGLRSHENADQPSVFDIYEDKNHKIWLGILGGGLARIDYLNIEMDSVAITELTELKDTLPSNNILCLEGDADGNIWVGTWEMGVFKISLDQELGEWKVLTYDLIPSLSSINEETIWDIMLSSTGQMWFATSDHGVARLIDSSSDTVSNFNFTNYSIDEGLPLEKNLKIMEDREGVIWIGSNGKGLVKYFALLFLSVFKK